MLRIRASTLEKYRRSKVYDYVEQGELINYVKDGQNGEESEAMKIGTAWHKCLENPAGTQINEVLHRYDGWCFSRTYLLRQLQDIGPGEREKEFLKVLAVPSYGDVELKGTVDLVHGMEINDYKVKVTAAPKHEEYERSLQWRIYLTIAEGYKFLYWLFETKEPSRCDDGIFVELKEPMVIAFWRYEGMEQEVKEALVEFLDWAAMHDLLRYLDKDYVLSKS